MKDEAGSPPNLATAPNRHIESHLQLAQTLLAQVDRLIQAIICFFNPLGVKDPQFDILLPTLKHARDHFALEVVQRLEQALSLVESAAVSSVLNDVKDQIAAIRHPLELEIKHLDQQVLSFGGR